MYDHSRATEPLFYRAPHPPQVEPYEFQFAGAEYALSRDHCLIGDQPGLGKTCQAILIDNAIKPNRTLVVCPASLRLNWEREIWRWSTKRNVLTYPVIKSKDGVSTAHDFVIMSYALLTNPDLLAGILDETWDHVILDEAHAIKDANGNKRTAAILPPDRLSGVTGRFTLLSGTPMPNGQPDEVYNVLRLLDWEAIDCMSLERFREHYYDIGGGFVFGPAWDEGAQAFIRKRHWSNELRNVPVHLEALQAILRRSIMVRRLKADVLDQLPPVQWHPFPLSLTPGIRRVLKSDEWQSTERLFDLDPEHFSTSAAFDGSATTARRMMGEEKAPVVAQYVADLLDEVDKVVVAAWHRSVLEILRTKLKKFGVAYMDGNTTANNRQQAVDDFQERDDTRVIVGQMKTLGEGWTLTAAQDVVFAEPDWVPGNNEQMMNRINRIGQEGSYTLGHVPLVPDTVDERVLGNAIRKSGHSHRALDA